MARALGLPQTCLQGLSEFAHRRSKRIARLRYAGHSHGHQLFTGLLELFDGKTGRGNAAGDPFKRIDFAEEIEAILVVVQWHRPNGRLFLQINGTGPEASGKHEPHDLVRPAEG